MASRDGKCGRGGRADFQEGGEAFDIADMRGDHLRRCPAPAFCHNQGVGDFVVPEVRHNANRARLQKVKGAELHRDLDLRPVELVVRKGFRREIDSYSAFFENDRRTPTGLAGYLRERGFARVFLAGLATDYCVHYSALDARREGFDVVVVEDACRAIDLQGSLARAFSEMSEAGVRRMWSEEFDAG